MMIEPKLRFKADDGSDFPDWEEKTLGELANLFTGKSFTSELSESGRYVVMDMGSVSSDGLIIDSKLTDSNRDLLRKGDLIMPKDDIGGGLIIGKTAYIPCDKKYVCGDHVYRLRFDNGIDALFMHYEINSSRTQKRLRRKVTGSAQLGLNSKSVLYEIVSVPSLPEQRKIADLLSAVDDVIAAQEVEVAAWEKRKKGVMQKLLSQEVRFKADDGSNFPDWEEKTLGNLGTFLKGAPLSKSDITDEGTPLILYGELYTTYAEVAYSIARRTDKKVPDKFYSKVGDVVIPTSGETPEEISTATCVMKDGVILAGDLYIYRPATDVDGRILSYLLNHQVNNAISRIAQGKSVVHVQSKELERIHAIFPSSPIEQRKIADCLASLDDVIAKAKDELDAWRELKKGLLQQMFV